MAKVVNKSIFKAIEFGTDGYNDLSGFAEVKAEAGSKGEIGITDCGGSKRVRLSKNLFSALEEAKNVKVLTSDTQMAFKAVPEGTLGAYELKKGAVIYNTDLAEKIMRIAKNTVFENNCTTRCGSIAQIQSDENGNVTVILNFD